MTSLLLANYVELIIVSKDIYKVKYTFISLSLSLCNVCLQHRRGERSWWGNTYLALQNVILSCLLFLHVLAANRSVHCKAGLVETGVMTCAQGENI